MNSILFHWIQFFFATGFDVMYLTSEWIIFKWFHVMFFVILKLSFIALYFFSSEYIFCKEIIENNEAFKELNFVLRYFSEPLLKH